MSAEILSEILSKADLLSSDEQLQVIAALAEKARTSASSGGKHNSKWVDMAGLLPYPACGQDAQEYISKSRQESSAKRNRLLK